MSDLNKNLLPIEKMRQHLESLVEELKRLKQSGISTVSICDSTMDGLRKAVAGLSGDVESSSEKISEAPYTYRNGWCDLTLIKNSKVYFIDAIYFKSISL